jgi:ribulose-bisphosphate carboxylase large chain
MITDNPSLRFSQERFRVLYQLSGYQEDDARAISQFICVEQTIEFPHELVPPGEMHDQMVGQVESFTKGEEQTYRVLISYAVETSGFELAQYLNVVYGNISFLPGIRVERLELPPSLTCAFKGPRFGRVGIRELVGAPARPLVSTALKPMGLSPLQMAEMAFQCALGGIDIVKDDHGLSDQEFCPFRERVSRCVEAVQKANQTSGFHSLYFPALSGRMEEFIEKAHFAKEQGADGLMLMPAFSGFDTARMLAEDDDLALPIMFHPGFYGTYRRVTEFGISPFVLHGQLPRLFGADITIFPHFEGRFAPPREECRAAADGTAVEMGEIKTIMPSPAGGVKAEFVRGMAEFYGPDVICLAASNLHRMGPDLIENSRKFRQEAEQAI